jgi:hypothetical protein
VALLDGMTELGTVDVEEEGHFVVLLEELE